MDAHRSRPGDWLLCMASAPPIHPKNLPVSERAHDSDLNKSSQSSWRDAEKCPPDIAVIKIPVNKTSGVSRCCRDSKVIDSLLSTEACRV